MQAIYISRVYYEVTLSYSIQVEWKDIFLFCGKFY